MTKVVVAHWAERAVRYVFTEMQWNRDSHSQNWTFSFDHSKSQVQHINKFICWLFSCAWTSSGDLHYTCKPLHHDLLVHWKSLQYARVSWKKIGIHVPSEWKTWQCSAWKCWKLKNSECSAWLTPSFWCPQFHPPSPPAQLQNNGSLMKKVYEDTDIKHFPTNGSGIPTSALSIVSWQMCILYLLIILQWQIIWTVSKLKKISTGLRMISSYTPIQSFCIRQKLQKIYFLMHLLFCWAKCQ